MRLLRRQKKLSEQVQALSEQLGKFNMSKLIDEQIPKQVVRMEAEQEKRLATLEAKFKLIWDLFTEVDKRDQPKLNKSGKRLAGEIISMSKK